MTQPDPDDTPIDLLGSKPSQPDKLTGAAMLHRGVAPAAVPPAAMGQPVEVARLPPDLEAAMAVIETAIIETPDVIGGVPTAQGRGVLAVAATQLRNQLAIFEMMRKAQQG